MTYAWPDHLNGEEPDWESMVCGSGDSRPWELGPPLMDCDDPTPQPSGARNVDANDLFVEGGASAIIAALDTARWLPPVDETASDRRRRQRSENVTIGEGTDTIPVASIYTLQEMIDRFVFIKDGSQVALKDQPRSILSLADFKNDTAASKHWISAEGRQKARPAWLSWLESPHRAHAEALTFRAGGMRMTPEPGSGKEALNMWSDIVRLRAPKDWHDRADVFVQHIGWLWGSDAPAFLDWLAHIEQRPGVLPHYGWVHISREHGKGRNWISSVLTRVWSGYVAASLDLVPLLDGSFNGNISRKLLAIVDEINEGGSTKHSHAQKLRQIVTEEQRHINPKYGRQRVEYNSCRWLMFSNHTGALPLTEDDRRFWVVGHEGSPKDGPYYTRLYHALSDPLFIVSVAELLRRRNLADFRPGDRPPMNQAKADLIAFGMTDEDTKLKEIAARWPVEVVTNGEISDFLGDGAMNRQGMKHSLERAGIRKLGQRVRIDGQGLQNLNAIKRFHQWKTASPGELNAEVNRASIAAKSGAMDGET